MTLKTGDMFAGKYRLISRIGEGGYGYVWRAHHESMGRDVAIKTLRAEAASRPEEVERFRREVFNASCLKHPNTITLHDYGQAEDGTLFIVMEYLVGMNLGQWLINKGPFSHDATLHILEQILRSMREAHHQKILHRDIKPENIFLGELDDVADELLVKVLDFGLSKAIGGSRRAFQRTLTKEGQVYGTPQYMSPEQACAMKLSPASDIYALGLLCWETLTGHCAFTGATPVDVLLKQVNEPTPPLPPALRDTVLDAFIQRATRKSQTERFASAREALEWLLQARDAEQRRALTPPSLPDPLTTINAAVITDKNRDALLPPQPIGIEPWFSHREVKSLDLDELDLRLTQLPMMGRQQELQELLKWGQQAMITGGTLWIRGEPGIGKTRLLQEWLRHMEMYASVSILKGIYTKGGRDLKGLYDAFSPLIQEPEHPRQAPAIRVDAEVRDNIRSLIAQADHFTKLSPEDPSFDPIVHKLEHTLYLIAHRRPTILVLEDLHHADPLSLKLVDHWKTHMATRAIPLVLVFTQSTNAAPPHHLHHHTRYAHIQSRRGGLMSSTYSYDLHLAPLSDDDAYQLLDDLLPFSHHLKQRLVHTARGNALSMVKIVRYLFSEHLVERNQEGLWTLIVSDLQQGAPKLLPPDLEQMLIARIHAQLESHRLSPILKALLVRAMLLGDSFETRLLKSMLRTEKRQDLEAYLDDAIEYFTQTSLLITATVEGRPGFEFGYEMLRDTLLTQTPSPDEPITALHRLVAQTKESYYHARDPELVDFYAHDISAHWELAEAPDEALTWLMRAARYAERMQNFHAALEHLERVATRLTPELDPDGELQLEVWLAQGRMFRFLGEFEPAQHTLTKAVEETQAVGDLVGEALTGEALAGLQMLMTHYDVAHETYLHVKQLYQQFGEVAGELRCELGLAELARFRGNYVHAQRKFESVLEQAVTLRDRPLQARALFGQGQCAYAEGTLKDATDLFRRARKLAETMNDALLCSEADIELATLAISTHHIEHAISTVNLAMELKRQIGDTLGQAHAHLILGLCLRRTHRVDEALQHARRAQKLNARLDHRYGQAKSVLLLSEISWTHGIIKKASELASEARAIHDAIDDVHGIVMSALQQSLCSLELKDTDQAKFHLDEADALISQHQLTHYRPSMLIHMGMVHEQRQHFEQARQHYQEAVDLAAGRGHIETAALASINLTRALITLGRLDEAREQAQLAMTRAEYIGHNALLMFSLSLSALIARLDRRTEQLTSTLRRLRVLSENSSTYNLNIPGRMQQLAHDIAAEQPGPQAFPLQLAIVETLRSLDANELADQLAQHIMKRS